MNRASNGPQSPAPDVAAADRSRRDGLSARVGRAVTLARLALFWEDLWPRLVWPLGIVGLFVAVSWLDLWPQLPDSVRLGLLAAFALAFLVSLFAFRGLKLSDRAMALARVEARSGHAHRPLQALDDTLPPSDDPVTVGLWRAHRQRLAASIGRLTVGAPTPGLARADRYGLRLMLALALFVGYFAAGDNRLDRLSAAFRPIAAGPALESRLDAWITPPPYTGLPSIVLTGDTATRVEAGGAIRVPQGSVLAIRYSAAPAAPRSDVSVEAMVATKTSPVAPKEAKDAPQVADNAAAGPAASRPSEFELKLTEPAEVGVRRDGARLAQWRFMIDPDRPPTIKLVGQPETQRSGALKFIYEVADDYGVAGAEAKFSAIATGTATTREPHPLVGAPDFALSLPSGHPKAGRGQTFHDMTSHPWAGARVRLTLVAHDDAGQEGRSETVDVKLPEKIFIKPLARALVEQRRVLALDTGDKPKVEDAFDALLFAPEHFIVPSGIYLAMREIQTGLKRATSDDDLRASIDQMWQLANAIEDGNLSEAERTLRNAEEALRKGLEQGASDQEIAKLTDDLRKALDQYMRELAEQLRRNPQAQTSIDRNQRRLRPQDLNKMLDRIENLARTGSRDAARQMLSEMQRMLENLRAARNGQQADPGSDQDAEALDKLGEVIQREQRLMDKTGRLGAPGSTPTRPDGKPMTPEEFRQAMKDLMKEQSELRQALKDLGGKLPKPGPGKQPGNQPNGKPGSQQSPGADPLGEAGEAMGDAETRLGENDAESATEAEGRALEKLREGARQMIEQMAGRDPNGRPGGPRPDTGEAEGDDPLGRPRQQAGIDRSNSVKVPDEIDVQRARRILDDIRRRLSETARPQLELDYLERLLRSE